MSQTTTALLVKLIVTFVAAWIVFSLFDSNAVGTVFLVALIGTIANYLVGDLMVLPNFGNLMASFGDGLMGAVIAYIIALLTRTFEPTFFGLVIYALLIAVFEYFFHGYLQKSEKVAP